MKNRGKNVVFIHQKDGKGEKREKFLGKWGFRVRGKKR